MGTVYTSLILEGLTAGGDILYDGPPGGFRDVFTDMALTSTKTFPNGTKGMVVLSGGIIALWATDPKHNYGGYSHHWTGRQVFDVGDSCLFRPNVFEPWTVRVSGFRLKLP